MTYEEIDKRLSVIPIYAFYISIFTRLNYRIEKHLKPLNKHPLFTFEEFYTYNIFAESGNERLYEYYKRRMK